MKKTGIALMLMMLSTAVLSADQLDQLLAHKNNPVAAFQTGKAIGCSPVIVSTVFDAYDWWYKKGKEAASRDLEIAWLNSTAENFNSGLAEAAEASSRYSAVVNTRYQELFTLACERGFRKGYADRYHR